MKLIALCILALTSSAAAFAPRATRTTSSSLQAKAASPFADEIGAQIPLGYWDPLGICADGNKENFDRLRGIEIKHGRVAMLAVVGYLVTYAGVRFPGAENVPSGFAAWGALPTNVVVQMCFTWLTMEMVNRDLFGLSEFPGDFRNGALDFGWDKKDDKWKRQKRSIELNNGRAAQMGILGLMVHEQLGNLDVILPLAHK